MQKFNGSISQNQNKVLLISIVINVFLLAIFNEKSYILATLLFGVIIFFFTEINVIQTIFLTTILVLPFEHGIRNWIVANFYFGISLKLIFSISVALMIITKKKYVNTILKKPYVYFWIWIFLVLLSSFQAPMTNLSWLVSMRLLVPFILFICGSILFTNSRKLVIYCLIVISSSLFIQSVVGVYQTINQSLLSVFLEETSLSSGFSTTDGERFFRNSGLMGHPTFFGTFLSMLLPLITAMQSSSLFPTKLQKYFLNVTKILTVIAVIGTYSRSAWLTLIAFATFIIFWQKKSLLKLLNQNKTSLIVLIVAVFIFIPLIISRLNSLATFLTLGNGPGRLTLINSAKEMIVDFPFLGVGPGHFTTTLKTYGLNETTKGFIYPVHNTLLLMMSEFGVPAALFFCLGVFLILKHSFPKSPKDPIRLGLWLAAIAFILNSQVHPLLYQDPTFDYFFLLLSVLITL